jgi:murein DD-endopeptidase MepM/ murein hydrolase activator NlpD
MRFRSLIALMILFSSFAIAKASDAIIYPFDQIAKSSCKFERWETLSDDCKQAPPHIDNHNYSAYANNQEIRRNYSVLWTASYAGGWDMGNGAHLGIDMTTSAGTPVRTIMAGKVIVAGWKAGWGNTVSVRHTLESGRVIWSNYTHMESVSVIVGQSLSIGELVGKVGSTGNSTGNHLHFQIDITDQGHPYYYTAC